MLNFCLCDSCILIVSQRALPPGLSARDAKILKSVQRRAHYLDKGFSIAGFRFGWTFIIGIIPVVGDLTDVALNYGLVVRKARQSDIPPWLLRHMLFNNAVSAGVGFVPVVGDLVLAVYKANSRNAILLEEFLRIRGEEFLRLQEGEAIVSSSDENGNGKKKKKKKGVSKKDAEQVKPGSGIVPGEVVPSASGKKTFSFFGRGGKSNALNAAEKGKAPLPGSGRFVEDVGPSTK